MNAWDLFEALSGIEPTQFADVEPKKYRKVGLRFCILAATIALLVGTAVAVGLGAHVRFEERTVELQGVSLLQEGELTHRMTYHTACVNFEMSTVELRANRELSRNLTEQWLADPSIREAALLTETGARRSLGTVSEAEAFLGIELLDDAELEALVRGIFVTMMISDTARLQEEFSDNRLITPDGLIVYLSLRRQEDSVLDPTLVSESGITVYIALTDAFLRNESEQNLYSHENEGKFQESGLFTRSGKSLLLLENQPNTGFLQTGYAVWCSNGLGYLAHIKTHANSYATPLSLITPLLYDI